MKGHALSSSSHEAPRLTVESLRFDRGGPYSFSLNHGICAGLKGVSGVGKTRLLRALADIDPSTGSVVLNGRGREDYKPHEWRRLVAMIPAESRWWHPLVGDHLPLDHDPRRADELLRSCGFEPDVLRWDVTRLSTGEKQRLSLVRALIRDPQVLLLDEVGSGLDRDNTELLEALVQEYLEGNKAAAIWVSHNQDLLERVATLTLTMLADGLRLTSEKESR
ncbi:MAG: ABC transporter ATP-binding protein [Desulfofustis sp.]|nr:ABC transporter ATP-binding protein [Desulfofustis sp.]MBT8354751.1 ABC transporter ATP-binding protein [Desulfofustis sp.]NNK58912.1 ATP-binding cassette domain-containing protein [Desulfofustis sp.]